MINITSKKIALRLSKAKNRLKNIFKQKLNRYQYIVSLYECLLNRKPEQGEIEAWVNSNYTEAEILKIFTNSEEYLRKEEVHQQERHQYVTDLYKCLLEREPEEEEVPAWTNSPYNDSQLLKIFLDSEEYINKDNLVKVDLSSTSFGKSYIVGESLPIRANQVFYWYKAVAEAVMNQSNQTVLQTKEKKSAVANLTNNHDYTLTIITSIYKAEKYLQAFMENITNQTIFAECQLFIVDANSPEKEYEIVNQYLEIFPNIKYFKMDKTIGIYEAWNLAIKESESEFITNANVDDLHRKDGLELKVKALQENPDIDVAYSDVYYFFIANLPFEIVKKGGIKTNLPIANKSNLLNFNSPHNSPIWRRSLHKKIGYFDTNYKSASDHEFWLRAAYAGANFLKISKPVISYYLNPDGMSTRKDSPGDIEGPQIVEKYAEVKRLQTELKRLSGVI
jgi:GT2 family glycosyltransferase